MTASELATMLRARRHSGYWMASCPVHGRGGRDRNPSVSIRDGKNGVSVRCFAGCDTRDILREIGLTFHDLGFSADPGWKRRIRPTAVRPAGDRKPLGKLEAIYPYTDSHGEIVAEKLRFEGKVFLWRRPQAGGGWIWKVDRETLPLFQLHLLIASKTAILVEGEKDALNLSRVIKPDVAITTAPNGAKSWRPEFAEYFRGKQAWIIPDFDEPGRVYAQTVANQLAKIAHSVRVVSVAPCKDVSDYLIAHSPDALALLFRGASRWRLP